MERFCFQHVPNEFGQRESADAAYGSGLMFYQYLDPFNTSSYADVMKDNGYDAIVCNKTFLYVKKTFLGRIGQVYYPTNRVSIPSNVRFCDIHGLLEPLPYATKTDYNNIVHVDLSRPSDTILKWLDKQRRWGNKKSSPKRRRGLLC
jgi:hypothetical protein